MNKKLDTESDIWRYITIGLIDADKKGTVKVSVLKEKSK